MMLGADPKVDYAFKIALPLEHLTRLADELQKQVLAQA
jgi:hypothetical protein